PYPRTYDYSNLVTFRKKGGVMEDLYRVEQTITLNMDDENIYDGLEHFNASLQNRIKSYIEERKRDFIFERPEFMFWMLKKEEELLHKPETDQVYNSHIYYTYDELIRGKKKVIIASKQPSDKKVNLESEFKNEFKKINKIDVTNRKSKKNIKIKNEKKKIIITTKKPSDKAVDIVSEFKYEIKQINKIDVTNTEREQIIKARIGQSAFKLGLLKKETKCNLCSVKDERLLIASHIKPWRECDTSERLDLDNGLLLCPNHDWLFDKGYISFTDKGDILINETLNESTKTFMNLNEKMNITLNKNQKVYIEWHRNNIFIK